jgi:hypothetical protein
MESSHWVDNCDMNDAPASINVGLVGSLTMIFLVTAVTLLLVSFYRRYKRAAEKPDSEQQ